MIRPSIDAFAPKNAEQAREQSLAILATAGIRGRRRGAPTRRSPAPMARPGRVERRAEMLEEEPLAPDVPVVMQVSRWDQLKDPLGVLGAFAEHVAPPVTAPTSCWPVRRPRRSPTTPRAPQVLDAVRARGTTCRRRSAGACTSRSLPMDDIEENAAIVNALQRHADVVVQKSLAEGFGLTVAEAMWKQRPVVASRIGGIRDQIEDGRSGLLLPTRATSSRLGRRSADCWRTPIARRDWARRPPARPAAVPRPAPPRALLRGDPPRRFTATTRRRGAARRGGGLDQARRVVTATLQPGAISGRVGGGRPIDLRPA